MGLILMYTREYIIYRYWQYLLILHRVADIDVQRHVSRLPFYMYNYKLTVEIIEICPKSQEIVHCCLIFL